MNLQHRIYLMKRLGEYILSDNEKWIETKEKASRENGWFIPEFINTAVENIAVNFLAEDILHEWSSKYQIPDENNTPKKVGIIMAGNIPLVGFHDLLCVFISGHKAVIKTSSKDNTLIRHLVDKLIEWDPEITEFMNFSDMLKGCDAYIATGSNNSSRYFEYYFNRFPNIIRKNRTSVAILDGQESDESLSKLADDVFLYFGLGCRNVTKIYVPENYNFERLLQVFKKYDWLAEYNKYKNNYDYNLAIHLLNGKYYMSNDAILLVEEPSLFSPISQLNYEVYESKEQLVTSLANNPDVQCIAGSEHIPLGLAQCPGIMDYADAVDTMKFLTEL